MAEKVGTTTEPAQGTPESGPAASSTAGETENHSAPPAPPAPPAQPAAPAAPATPFVFTIDGQQTSDFAAVQARLDAQAEYIKSARDEGRKNYVTQLSNDKKIPAPMLDDYIAHSLTLSDEQWDAFRKMYDSSGAAPLFAQFSAESTGDGSTPNTQPNAASAKEQRIEVLKSTVNMHSRAGMSQSAIESTDAWRELSALTDNKEK